MSCVSYQPQSPSIPLHPFLHPSCFLHPSSLCSADVPIAPGSHTALSLACDQNTNEEEEKQKQKKEEEDKDEDVVALHAELVGALRMWRRELVAAA